MRNCLRSRCWVVMLIFVLALTAPTTAGLPAGAQPLRIGALLPLSGELNAFGGAHVRAALLALEHVNEQGGILGGRKLEILFADSGTDSERGVAAAKRLVEIERVPAIIGTDSSSVIMKVATEVTIPNRVVLISPSSTATQLSTIDKDDFLFRNIASDQHQGQALGTLAARLGYTRIALLYQDDIYGRGLVDEVIESFEALGGTISAAIAFTPRKVLYADELECASRDDAQALVLLSYPDSGIAIVRQALTGDYFDTFLFPDAMKTQAVVDAGGAPLEGAWGTAPSPRETPSTRVFKALYEARYGPQKTYPLETYDATFLIALAIEKAGEASGPAIRDALRQIAGGAGVEIMPGEWAKAVALIRAGQEIRYGSSLGLEGFDEYGDLRTGSIGVWTVFKGEIRVVGTERFGRIQ